MQISDRDKILLLLLLLYIYIQSGVLVRYISDWEGNFIYPLAHLLDERTVQKAPYIFYICIKLVCIYLFVCSELIEETLWFRNLILASTGRLCPPRGFNSTLPTHFHNLRSVKFMLIALDSHLL